MITLRKAKQCGRLQISGQRVKELCCQWVRLRLELRNPVTAYASGSKASHRHALGGVALGWVVTQSNTEYFPRSVDLILSVSFSQSTYW